LSDNLDIIMDENMNPAADTQAADENTSTEEQAAPEATTEATPEAPASEESAA